MGVEGGAGASDQDGTLDANPAGGVSGCAGVWNVPDRSRCAMTSACAASWIE